MFGLSLRASARDTTKSFVKPVMPPPSVSDRQIYTVTDKCDVFHERVQFDIGQNGRQRVFVNSEAWLSQ